MLSHYDAVIWETGNDLITRTAGRAGGNADRLALDELLEFRSYMNEGGKVLLAGDSAGLQYTMAQLYDPKGEIACNPPPAGVDPRRCLPLFGSFFGGDTTNDALQYYLGGTSSWPTTVTSTAVRSTRWASPTRSRAPWGLDDPVFAGNTPEGRRSSPPAGSCRPPGSRSSRAELRRGTTSRAARSTRTPEPSTCTRRSPTSPTRGSPARSPCRQPVGR